MSIEIKDGIAYVDSFADAMKAAVDNPEIETVVFNKASDYYVAASLAKAFKLK